MRIIFTILALFCSLTGFSQLTKSETIKYLNTRLEEAKGLSVHYNGERQYIISNTSVYESTTYPNRICFAFTRTFTDGAIDRLENIFDPTHLLSFNPISTNYDDAVKMLSVNFEKPTFIIKQTTNGRIRYLDGKLMGFPFLTTEPLNVERMQKALLHLRKLYQDAKPLDPFLN
jgi:hypothetical protein